MSASVLAEFEALQEENDQIYQYLQLNNRPSSILNIFGQLNANIHELGPMLVQPGSILTQSKMSVLRNQYQLVTSNQLGFVKSRDVQQKISQHLEAFATFSQNFQAIQTSGIHGAMTQSNSQSKTAGDLRQSSLGPRGISGDELVSSMPQISGVGIEAPVEGEWNGQILGQAGQSFAASLVKTQQEVQVQLSQQILRVHQALQAKQNNILKLQEQVIERQGRLENLPDKCRSFIQQNSAALDEKVAQLGQAQLGLLRQAQVHASRLEDVEVQTTQLGLKLHEQQLQNFNNEQNILRLVQEIAVANSKVSQYEQKLSATAAIQEELRKSLEQLLQLKQKLDYKVSQAQTIQENFNEQKRYTEDQIHEVNQKIQNVAEQNRAYAQINDDFSSQLREIQQQTSQKLANIDGKIDRLEQIVADYQVKITRQKQAIQQQDAMLGSIQASGTELGDLATTAQKKQSKFQWE